MPINNGMQQQVPINGSQAPKNNKVLIIIIIVLGIIIVGLAGVIGMKLLSNDNGNSVREEDNVQSDGNVGTVDNSYANTKTINHNGYVFTVDSGVEYREENGVLILVNSANTASVQLTSVYGGYNDYLLHSDSLKQQLETGGYGTITYQAQKYNNRDYMVFSGILNNIPFNFFIVGLDRTHVFQGMMITKTGNEFADGYNLIEDLVSDVNGGGSSDTSSTFSIQIPESNNGEFFQSIQ